MSALDANDVTFPMTRNTGATANPEPVSNVIADVTAEKAVNNSIHFKNVTPANPAIQVKF